MDAQKSTQIHYIHRIFHCTRVRPGGANYESKGGTPLSRVGPEHLIEIGGFFVGRRQQNISATQKLDITTLFFN